MTLTTLYRGEDHEEIITIENKSGAAINIATLDNIYIIIYNKNSRITVAQYSYVLEAGYEEISDYDVANGQVLIRILGADTEDAQTGLLCIEYKYKLPDVAYTDGDFEGIKQYDAFILSDSKTGAL